MKITKAVIPAAGLGTRMLPATKTIPKEMLPVVDKPLIQYIVEEAVAAGIEDILIITNRAKSALTDYFDYHPELEQRLTASGRLQDVATVRGPADAANICFTRQKETLGLGHAVWCARRFVGNQPFAVLLGDDVMRSRTPVIGQLIDAASRYHASAVGVQAVPPEDIGRYCSLAVEPVEPSLYRVSGLVEKPTPDRVLSLYAVLGRYVLTPGIFHELENMPRGAGGEIQLTDGIHALCQKEPVYAVDFEGKRYDAGHLCGYLETVIDFALEHPETGDWLRGFLRRKIVDKP